MCGRQSGEIAADDGRHRATGARPHGKALEKANHHRLADGELGEVRSVFGRHGTFVAVLTPTLDYEHHEGADDEGTGDGKGIVAECGFDQVVE